MFGSRSFLRRQPLRVLLTSLIFTGMAANGAPPAWWSAGDPPVWDETRAEIPGVNKGVANIGQAKHMVQRALETLESIDGDLADEIRTKLTTPQPSSINPSQTNPPVLDLTVPSPKTPEWMTKQKAPLLIGQLKAISKPFYDELHQAKPAWLETQLIENGMKDLADSSNFYPWSSTTTDDQNLASANIGQLKAVFSLPFEYMNYSDEERVDTDGDGLPDYWEVANGLDPNDNGTVSPENGAEGDPDGDGVSNAGEYRAHTSPANGNDFPTEVRWVTNYVHAGAHNPQTVPITAFVTSDSWNSTSPTTVNSNQMLTATQVENAVSAMTFPLLPALAQQVPGALGKISIDYAYYSAAHAIYGLDHSGNNQSAANGATRSWVCAPSKPVDQDFYFLKRTFRSTFTIGNSESVDDPAVYEKVKLTVLSHTSVSPSIDLKGISTFEAGKIHTTNVSLHSAGIVPDDNMEGVLGGIVKSKQADSLVKHFVTPKKSEDLTQQYVVLKAGSLTPEAFEEFYEWECDPGLTGGVGASSNKYKISRESSGVVELKIKTKSDGAIVSRMKIWVVWCDNTQASIDPIVVTETAQLTHLQCGVNHKWWVVPQSILANGDVPNFERESKVAPPNAGKVHLFSGEKLAGGVGANPNYPSLPTMWDCTRQYRVKILNPNLIPKADLPVLDGPLFSGQPLAVHVPDVFPPPGSVEGNDDSNATDERNNPYSSILESKDSVQIYLDTTAGQVGNSFEQRCHFKELVRLEIGSKWYRVSEMKPWKAHLKLRKQAEAGNARWKNNASVVEKNHNGF